MSKLPPPSPQFGQLVQLFSDVKIQDREISLELKYYIYDIYILYIPPKVTVQVQIIGILVEVDSFY